MGRQKSTGNAGIPKGPGKKSGRAAKEPLQKKDEFSNDDVRPILEVIESMAGKFKKLEEILDEKYQFFEGVIESHELNTLKQEAEDENPLLAWLLGAQDEDEEDSSLKVANPVGLYFKVMNNFYDAYQQMLGFDLADPEEVFTDEYLEAHPEAASNDDFKLFCDGLSSKRALKTLRKFEQFRQHPDYPQQPLKDRQQNAISELEAIRIEAGRYLSLVERVQGMLSKADDVALDIYKLASREFSQMQDYHAAGNKIVKKPSLTALARVLFEKMEGIDQVKKGLEPHELSDHVVNNAARLLCALVDTKLYGQLCDENKIITFATQETEKLHKILKEMLPLTIEYKKAHSMIIKETEYAETTADEVEDPSDTLRKLKEINFDRIKFKAPKRRKSKVEERTDEANNQAYALIITELDKLSKVKGEQRRFSAAKKTVISILEQRRKLVQEEGKLSNYYRCGEGEHEQITLRLADPPRYIDPASIRGLNFEEVRRHYSILNSQQRYQAVAKLMSPSGKINENFLLLGPPGCGKTELVRALGSDTQSIFVEVRGSNVTSMWQGQTEKNPMRIFQQAEELSKAQKKRVNVFIDEAEAILAPPQGYGEGSNKRVLSELNAILDGTYSFEGVNLIVALNSLDNVKLSNLRRFRMYIVGELSLEDRAALLEDFVNRGLPAGPDMDCKKYRSLAGMIPGATGAIIRYPVDIITQHFWEKLYATKRSELERINDELIDEQGQFDLSRATPKQRDTVKELLRKSGYVVTYRLLKSAVTKVAGMQAVQEQIRNAEEFYEKAKREAEQLRMGGLDVKG
jgi:GTPase SAR1 family protein